jgi:hypothetical protein
MPVGYCTLRGYGVRLLVLSIFPVKNMDVGCLNSIAMIARSLASNVGIRFAPIPPYGVRLMAWGNIVE